MSDALRRVIREEIEASPDGRISFRRFMELALTHPRWGYYCREGVKIGREGDFFTSPLTGAVFGQTWGAWLGRLAARWPSGQPWWLVEAGPGDGRLALQILEGLAASGYPLPKGYGLVEVSSWHRRLQAERLRKVPVPVHWLEHPEDLPDEPVILISNEFFDTFPVHRVVGSTEGLLEWYVTWEQGRLVEVRGPISNPACIRVLQEMKWPSLAEGEEVEVPLDAGLWYRNWVGRIQTGWMITVDYGGTMEELAHPARRQGTLRGYRRHHLVNDWLETPGETDLTCDVHFSALQHWGEKLGWETRYYGSQSRFLIEAGILDRLQSAVDRDPFSPMAKRNRAIRQLALPGGMGESFRVLVQGKGVSNIALPKRLADR
ncbi:class I SAM-dependent methyltransferase [Desmospora profundinema]|uniref:SAM-dependent MidA family methyltransferase n=1 Tax=Desmospora profundinema TaxID=1571184 RepID=A0ABU1IJ70_9BACL|nr:SAM-dependent methyltransferase [Desmospora profundinema]MDR6224824.1 SAM-dependent MidA family methyltransferase [Desmospora profundinema]